MNYRNPRAINLTPIFVLIAVNILIFIATSIKPEAIDLLGANHLIVVAVAEVHNAMLNDPGLTADIELRRQCLEGLDSFSHLQGAERVLHLR